MARYRENETITKKRNDRIINIATMEEKKEKNLKKKATAIHGSRNEADAEAEAVKPQKSNNGGTKNKSMPYKFVPSNIIAFQNLVPMKTLILDVVRELIRTAAVPHPHPHPHTVSPSSQSEDGGESALFSSADPSITPPSSESPLVNEEQHSHCFNAIEHEGQEIETGYGIGEDKESQIKLKYEFEADVIESGRLLSMPSSSASLIRNHMLTVLQDSCLLLLMLTELSISIQDLCGKLATAQQATGMGMTEAREPDSGGIDVTHCGRNQCLMELFEAYVSCPKCGIVCISCASGDGQENRGGCTEPGHNFSHKRNLTPSSISSDSKCRRVGPKRIVECRRQNTQDETSEVAAKKMFSGCWARADEMVEKEADNDDEKILDDLLQRSTTASMSASSIIIPHASSSSSTPLSKSSPFRGHSSSSTTTTTTTTTTATTTTSTSATTTTTASCLKGVAKKSHPHFKGAELLLKTSLQSLLVLPRDFANLIVHLHPCEASRVKSLDERFQWPAIE